MNANPDRDWIQQGLRPWIPSIWNNSADAFLAATKVTPTGDPASYDYAMQTPEAYQWQKAMEDELKSLQENGTWTLVDLPDGRTTVKNRWVYLTKRDTKGDIIRYKARLIAKGFTQTASLDYEETFAPVARLDSLRLLLAIAAVFDWEVHHVDIKTAYLNGHLNEEIYMDQPRGFEIQWEEKKACQLLKAIYGLKQAGRQWHEHLQRSLTDYGYKKLVSCDASIFFKHHDRGGRITIILVYVDDIAIFGSLTDMEDVKEFISSQYKYTDLGEIEHFLGLHITHDRSKKTLSIDQSHYIQHMLN